MITIDNYVEKIEAIGIDNLHPTLREGHEIMVEATQNFTNWNIYHTEPDFKRDIDEYLNKLNSFYSAKKDNKSYIIKDFYNQLNTFQKASLRTGNLSEDKLKLAATLGITISDLIAYDASIRKTDTPKELAPAIVEKPKVKRETTKKKQAEPVEPHSKRVEALKEEVKFFKRFVGLHNKTKTPNAILSFVKALQKSILQKKITKLSPYVDEIRKIQDKLVGLYNKMTDAERITINDKDLPKFVLLAGGEEVFPSINLIKRFIGIQGKPLKEKQLNALIKAIENARKKKKVIEGDPYLDKIISIEKLLKKSKADDTIQVEKASLDGLSGIVNGCSCNNGIGRIYETEGEKLRQCGKKTYTDAKRQGACSHNKGLSGVLTAEEMANRTFQTLTFTNPWNNIVAHPSKNFVMMLHGEPGSGKTSLLLKFSKYLAENFYKRVLYVTSEEFEATTMTMKVNELLIPRPSNFDFIDDVRKVDLKNYDLVILDSINDLGLTLADFKELKKNNKDTAFILVLQVTKAGNFRGGKEWEHEVQIAAKVEAGTITVYKNRFGRLRNDALNFFEAA